MAATTWNPNNKSGTVTLSGGNLTATVATLTGSVAATNAATGPTYFEVTAGASLTGTMAIGLANRTYSAAPLTTVIGSDLNSLGYNQAGAVKVNNVTLATIQTFAASDTICVAFDPQYQLIWFRVNGGNWNNDVIGNQNPVGLVGGISTGSMNQGVMFPAWGSTAVTPNQSGTAVFTSGFAQTPPTGYITVDTCAALGIASVKGNALASAAQVTPARTDPVTTAEQRCFWRGQDFGYKLYTPLGPTTGTPAVSGTVLELGSPVAKTVRLYDRAGGQLLGETTSDPSTGAFSIPALDRSNTYVVAFDPPTFNALVYDAVVPV